MYVKYILYISLSMNHFLLNKRNIHFDHAAQHFLIWCNVNNLCYVTVSSLSSNVQAQLVKGRVTTLLLFYILAFNRENKNLYFKGMYYLFFYLFIIIIIIIFTYGVCEMPKKEVKSFSTKKEGLRPVWFYSIFIYILK